MACSEKYPLLHMWFSRRSSHLAFIPIAIA